MQVPEPGPNKLGVLRNRYIRMLLIAASISVVILVVVIPTVVSLNTIIFNPKGAFALATPASGEQTPGQTSTGAATGTPGPGTPTGTAGPTSTAGPRQTPTPSPTFPPPSGGLLPGQQIWKNGVSSYLFGTNDSEDYDSDNFDTDPYHIIQPSIKSAGLTLMRMFIFHYSLQDGHRVTLGTHPQIQLNPNNPHEYDQPGPAVTTVTPSGGYELETRLDAIEKSGMQCLIVLKDIRTDPANPVDPNPDHKIYTDPYTGKVETDLDFAEKVVAYAGNRCNLYEIGNEPDLDDYTNSGKAIPHLSVQAYLNRWVEFVTALRKINPNAKFIGPVTYDDQGNDCWYGSGTPPVPGSQPGDCYMQNFLLGAKAAGALPDAVSFHWYPCDNATDGFNGSGNCGPKQAQSYASVTQEVKGWVKQDTGYDIPVGITEWNFDPGSNPLGDNGSFMSKFSTASLNAMISAGLNFACQFDAQSYGGYGYLDMFDINNKDQPKPQFTAIANTIQQYK
jgi:hypothetical protein